MTAMLEKMAQARCLEEGHDPDRKFGAPILNPRRDRTLGGKSPSPFSPRRLAISCL